MSAASPPDALTTAPPAVAADARTAPGPGAFVTFVWLVLLAQLSWAAAAVTLGMLGAFSLLPVLLLTGALTAGLWPLTATARRAPVARRARHTAWVRGAAVGVAVLAAAGNALVPGEHLQTGRDGGTYTATAGWLASDGGLVIDARVPPFDQGDDLQYFAAGFHEIVEDGPLYAQFMHAFPAMMATVGLAGGLDLMVRTNAVLGGIALLALYAFGERLVRPAPALLAQAALAGTLVFVYFTRAPFSELLTMSMVFGGLWALDQAVATRDRRTGVVAGLLLGGAFLARLDGLVVLLMLTLALLPPVVTGRVRRVAPAVLTGMAVTSAVAAVDLFVFAPFYVDLHVEFLVPLALAFAGAGLLAAAAGTHRGRATVVAVLRHRDALATGLAVAIVTGGVAAYLLRPVLTEATWSRTTPIGFLQQREGEPINEARTYAEDTARWLAWYLGLPALAAGVLGWAGLVRRTVAARVGRLVPFLLVFSGLTVLYLWRPSITPDHIWADRRFLPVVLPGLLLCAAWLLDRVWARADDVRWRGAVRAGVVATALLIVALPLRTTWPAIDLREQAGLAADVAAACEALGDDAALLFLDETGTAMHYRMAQPLRGHCGVPAAWTDESIGDDRLRALADRAGDRTLYLLAEDPAAFDGRPTGTPFTVLEHRGSRLEPTLTRVPQQREPYTLDVLAAPVVAGDGGGR